MGKPAILVTIEGGDRKDVLELETKLADIFFLLKRRPVHTGFNMSNEQIAEASIEDALVINIKW